MISYNLEGKVAVVTGGASGIGLVLTSRLLDSGASVIVNDLHPEKEQLIRSHLASKISDRHWIERFSYLPMDISSPNAPDRILSKAKTLGGLDYLLNNAGTPGTSEPIPFSELDRLDDNLWHKILEVNLLGPFKLTRALAPLLRERKGSIVNTASVAGLTGQASSMPYAASKSALINMTQNLARGLAPHIRVNAVAPGFVDTPWTKDWPADRRERSIQGTLLKRLGTPEDIAEVILFLAIGASFMTGQTVVADGGR